MVIDCRSRVLAARGVDGGVKMRWSTRTGAPVAYLGNDESDEDGFRILQNRGLCVLVRQQWRETAANLWLREHIHEEPGSTARHAAGRIQTLLNFHYTSSRRRVVGNFSC